MDGWLLLQETVVEARGIMIKAKYPQSQKGLVSMPGCLDCAS
jgi:hypothetical protein